MNTVEIREPMWKNGGSVGIAERKIGKEGTIVKIVHKNKQGELTYPNTYKVSREKAFSCEVMYVGKNKTPLRIIPIRDMEVQ